MSLTELIGKSYNKTVEERLGLFIITENISLYPLRKGVFFIHDNNSTKISGKYLFRGQELYQITPNLNLKRVKFTIPPIESIHNLLEVCEDTYRA